jgi:uncharacterized integral membrane protein
VLKFLNIFSQPYPFPYAEKTTFRILLHSLIEGAFIAAFLIFFQPFNTEQWLDQNKNFYLIGYGAMTALGGIILRLGIFRLFPRYHSEATWTVLKEILSILMLLLLITIFNLAYSKFLFVRDIQFGHFLWMFFTVCVVGLFPITIGVLLNYIYKLKKYSQPVVINPQNADNQTIEGQSETIKFIAENEKDTFELHEKDLFFIESSDNYSTIHFFKNDKIQKEMIRGSLSRMEEFIQSSKVVRCHRSFIVNLNKVEKVTGNAQGYKLHLERPEIIVPVARKYAEVIEKLK